MLMADPHARTAADCLADLNARPEGLTATQAAERLATHGPNRLPEARARGPVLRFLAQFNNVLIYVLLAAAVVTGSLQHWIDTGVILAVVLANAVIGFVQEGKAETAMSAIRQMLAPRAAVLRDAEHHHLDVGHETVEGRRGRHARRVTTDDDDAAHAPEPRTTHRRTPAQPARPVSRRARAPRRAWRWRRRLRR